MPSFTLSQLNQQNLKNKCYVIQTLENKDNWIRRTTKRNFPPPWKVCILRKKIIAIEVYTLQLHLINIFQIMSHVVPKQFYFICINVSIILQFIKRIMKYSRWVIGINVVKLVVFKLHYRLFEWTNCACLCENNQVILYEVSAYHIWILTFSFLDNRISASKIRFDYNI